MIPSFSLPHHYKLNYQKNSNILAEEYKVIYFNTQKNANSTMKAQFVEVLGLSKTKDFPKDVHYSYNFPAAMQSELLSTYRKYLKFIILRNPWERLVSCYKSKIESSSKTGEDYILDSSPDLYIGMPFEEFVEVVCSIPDSKADFHFCSQIYLALYDDGTFPMNYLCNMENLAFHIKEIKEKTGIPFTSLPQLNKSANFRYETFYTPDLVEKVAVRYQADVEFFQYKFGVENKDFPFGKVSESWKDEMLNHPMMITLIKEKNQELLQQVKLKKLAQTKEIKKMEKDIVKLQNNQRELHAIKASFVWKAAYPLRKVISFFLRKNTH
ncbi:sulfotransferase family 2 domain-containing protein [Neolewinella agarilytica]|uniref:Sulfotransferase family protein n=1 Tax=Neolewinella agarilytica TaxID=478744 RepID=A0A1H9G5Y7_9BACT|nr:sulfotransferase family 2 domain-containing protein [Neolewinella agarilytica]SEQ45420.1 Sulfotransferase family protein [Neolewinella agarilytica]